MKLKARKKVFRDTRILMRRRQIVEDTGDLAGVQPPLGHQAVQHWRIGSE